jgi:hypothetical protein
MTLSALSTGKTPANIAGEIFCDIVGDGEGGERAAGHEELLADFDNLDELGRVGVEVDHVAGFFSGLGAGVHGDTYVGLSECGGVVGAVAGHSDELTFGLLALDEVHFVFGLGFGEEVIHTRFARNDRGGEGIVAGDHDAANAHSTESGETIFEAAFDDVLEIDDTEGGGIFRNDEGRATLAGDFFDAVGDLAGKAGALLL